MTNKDSMSQSVGPRGLWSAFEQWLFGGGVGQRAGRRSSLEAFRMIQLRLGASEEAWPRVVVVTCAALDEGRSFVASGLASTLVRDGHRTLLVDADLYSATLHEAYNLQASPGLGELLAAAASRASPLDSTEASATVPLDAFVQHVPGGPDVLTAGGTTVSPAALFSESSVVALLSALRASAYRFVVINSPPLLEAGGASLLAAGADDLLLAVRAGRSRERDLREVRSLVERGRFPLRGAVLTEGGASSNDGAPSDSAWGRAARLAAAALRKGRSLFSRSGHSAERTSGEAPDGEERQWASLRNHAQPKAREGQLSG